MIYFKIVRTKVENKFCNSKRHTFAFAKLLSIILIFKLFKNKIAVFCEITLKFWRVS